MPRLVGDAGCFSADGVGVFVDARVQPDVGVVGGAYVAVGCEEDLLE